MDHAELLKLCLAHPGSFEDHPFDDTNWACARHRVGHKIFAFIYRRNGRLYINLKCEPMQADFLRSVYSGVTPGYHMNHQHWNTVDVNSDVPLHELLFMIAESHRLTVKKPSRSATGGKPHAK